MSITDEPIQTIEQAKRYYIAMGCRHFNIDRENLDRRDEYFALKISRETELEWRQEEIGNRITAFPFQHPRSEEPIFSREMGLAYSGLADMAAKTYDAYDTYVRENLSRLLALTACLYTVILPHQITLVINSIVGDSGSVLHGGILECAYNTGNVDLARNFAEYAKLFILRADENAKADPDGIPIHPQRVDSLVHVLDAMKVDSNMSFSESVRREVDAVNFNAYVNAAKQGNIESMYRLGIRYKSGNGCDKDLTQSKYWLKRASGAGLALANRELEELEDEIQLSEATK